MSLSIKAQVARLGDGPLTEVGIREHVWPLFSRTLARQGQIYLANHSLGRPLDQTAMDVREGLDLWYEQMDDAWGVGGWLDEINRFRANVAKLIGLADSSGVVPKTSAGQGLRAVLNSLAFDRQIRVVATRGEFDSVDFILKAYAEKGRVEIRWIEPTLFDQRVPLFAEGAILDAIDAGTDLLILSQVMFATGQIMPGLAQAVARAHEVGARVLVDSYHAVGVIPVSMEELDADFMIGGSYKYTRGGPGACWLAIHPRNQHHKSLDTGWFAKREPFGYERSELPDRAVGGDGWLESTPPILIYYQARAGLEFTLEVGIDRLRDYSLRQQALLRAELVRNGVQCFQPSEPSHYGAFALVPSSSAHEASNRLRELGVNTDARGNAIRFGPDILTTEDELRETANIVARIQA
jgi:kynureninase